MEVEVNSQFKSAEEWDKALLVAQNKIIESTGWTEKTLHDATIANYRAVQSNTMREAARIVAENNWPDFMTKTLLDAAIAIEKGEYKPV
jgi:hypothetical protein